MLLGVDGRDGSQDPALDPVGRGEQRSASSSGWAEVSGVSEAARYPPAGARSKADSAGGDVVAPLHAAGRSYSTPQLSGTGGPAWGLPPLLESPARGPFSELQRSTAADGRPEQAVELIPARPSGESHGAGAADERCRAGAYEGLAADGNTPGVMQEGAGFADVEGVGPLSVCGAEAHSRRQQDYYAATVAVDVLSFLYVAINYQVRGKRGTSGGCMRDNSPDASTVSLYWFSARSFHASLSGLPKHKEMHKNMTVYVQGRQFIPETSNCGCLWLSRTWWPVRGRWQTSATSGWCRSTTLSPSLCCSCSWSWTGWCTLGGTALARHAPPHVSVHIELLHKV